MVLLGAYDWSDTRNNTIFALMYPGSTTLANTIVQPNTAGLNNRGFMIRLEAPTVASFSSALLPDDNAGSQTAFRMAFRLLPSSSRTSGLEAICQIRQKSSTTVIATLYLSYSGSFPSKYAIELRQGVGGSIIYQTGFVYDVGVYRQFELKLDFVNATNAAMQTEGAAITPTATGASAAASTTWGQILWTGGGQPNDGSFCGVTDLIIWDGQANTNGGTVDIDDFIGDRIVNTIFPNAETLLGAAADQWVARGAASKRETVDDLATAAAASFDADYIEASGTSEAQFFGFNTPAFANDVGEVIGMLVEANVRSVASTTKNMILSWDLATVQQNSPVFAITGANWRTIKHRMEWTAQPAGPWPTVGEFGVVTAP